MIQAVAHAGYDYIAMDASLTRFGGVETRDEGRLYADWLKAHEGEYDGVIFSMPIFADENGADHRLCSDARVPILMQAYPDEIGKMDFAHRRDAYLRKVLRHGRVLPSISVPFTVMKPARGASALRGVPGKPDGFRRHLPGGERHEAASIVGLHRRAHHRL